MMNERIKIPRTLNPNTQKPSSYRACFFGYEAIPTPDTNGWYDDDGELNAELITSIEFGSHKSEAPVLWEQYNQIKTTLKETIVHLSMGDLLKAQTTIYKEHTEFNSSIESKYVFFKASAYNLLQAIEREILSRRS